MSLPSYNDYDQAQLGYRTQDLMRTLGADTVDDAKTKFRDLDKTVDYMQLSAMTSNNMNRKAVYDANFQKNTDLLAQLNESWNANRYISKSLTTEQRRISSLDSQARKDIYRLRQESMYLDYMSRYYTFVTNVMIFTLYVTLLALLPAAMLHSGRLSMYSVATIEGILLAFYLVILFVLYRRRAQRRTTDWTRYYWEAGKVVTDSGNSSTPDNCPSANAAAAVVAP